MALDTDDLSARYQLHRAAVLGLCRRLLRSSEHAEDATHEVFLRVHQHRSTYDPDRPFEAWVLTIATRYCIDQLRRHGTEAKLFGDEDVERAVSQPPSASPLGALLARERRLELQHAVAALPVKYRVPLVLAVYLERSYDEIGEQLDIPRSHVAVLIFRAKQLLRAQLALSSQPASEAIDVSR